MQFAQLFSAPAKRRIDNLFFLNAVLAAVFGSIAFLFPHAFEWFMIHHGEKLALRDNVGSDDQKITHLVTRLYGALIIAQAWITWNARQISDAHVRRALVQAFFVCFSLTTLALLRAQLTQGGGLNGWNWLNILAFTGMSAAYGWFSFFEKIAVFEGLGNATK